MSVETDDGTWMVPGERAVMIPGGTRHRVRMLGVRTASLYIESAAVPWWPASCEVVEVSALLRELLLAAIDLDAGYAASGRDRALISLVLFELSVLSGLPLHISLPRHPLFARLCREYLARPDLAVTNASWASDAALSERAFTRRFRQETGMSPASWRVKARLLTAIARLRDESVTAVAASLGYASPAAFSYAFSRAFAVAPSALRK